MKKCIYCQQTFKGRSDKKYCSVDCKNAYNNERRLNDEQVLIKINRQLRVNWHIMKTINPQGKTTVRKEYLHSQGYDFNYFTHIYKSRNGNVYFFCYDVGLTEVKKTHVCIVNWQAFMNSYTIPIAHLY